MQNHRSLRVYTASQRLAREVYLITLELPREERYALADQLRRAATSVGSNIAEGCGRCTPKDFSSYLDRALGSANEVESQLLQAQATSLLAERSVRPVVMTALTVQRMLRGLIKKVRSRGTDGADGD